MPGENETGEGFLRARPKRRGMLPYLLVAFAARDDAPAPVVGRSSASPSSLELNAKMTSFHPRGCRSSSNENNLTR